MSENGDRWNVDTRTKSQAGTTFDMTMLLLTDAQPGYLKFDPCDRNDLRDFIIELAHEIERLQTENIRLSDADKHRAKLKHSVISLSEIRKQQPFHMEPEK